MDEDEPKGGVEDAGQLSNRARFTSTTMGDNPTNMAARRLVQDLGQYREFDSDTTYKIGLFFLERARKSLLPGFHTNSMKVWAALMSYLRTTRGKVSVKTWDTPKLDRLVGGLIGKSENVPIKKYKLKQDLLRYARKLYISENIGKSEAYNELLKLTSFKVPYF